MRRHPFHEKLLETKGYTASLLFVATGLFICIIGAHILPAFFSNVLFGTSAKEFPFTFQMIMWVPLFMGLYSLLDRYLNHLEIRTYFDADLLRGKKDKIYDSVELAQLLKVIEPRVHEKNAVVLSIIQQVIYQFQSLKSVEEARASLNQLIEIFEKQFELVYVRVKYLSWLIPTLGFMGTVYGISLTVAEVGISDPDDPLLLRKVSASLAIAFDTTLLALIQSAFLLYIMSILESEDEKLLNETHQYIFENLVNRLDPYEQKAQ